MNTKKTMLALALCAVTIGGVAAYIHTRTHGAFASGKYVWQRQEWKSGCETFRVGEHLKATGYEDARGPVVNEYEWQPNIVLPDEIDNRAMCLPPYDQDNYADEICGQCAMATYAAVLYWKLTGKPVRFDPTWLKKLEDGKHPEEKNGCCFECQLNFFRNAIGIWNDATVVKTCRKDLVENGKLNDCVPMVKRIVHRDGVAIVMVETRDTWLNLKKTGIATIPHGGRPNGIHAVVVCGWTHDGFIIQNSWGRDWGIDGFAVFTFDDFTEQFLQLTFLDRKGK